MDKIVYQNLHEIHAVGVNNIAINLRPIRESDTDNIVRWRNNEQVRSRFIFREPFTREIHLKWLEKRVYSGEVIQYIAEIDDIPIGSVYIRNIDIENECGEFGIFIGEPIYTSRGLGTEIAKTIVSYCFDLGFHRIYLRVLAENIAARKSYQKAGFIQEGIAKDMVRIEGCWHDVVFMSYINSAMSNIHMRKS